MPISDRQESIDFQRERDEARADRDHYRDSLGATVTERDEWKERAEKAEARVAGRCTLAQTVDRDKLAESIEYAVNAKGTIRTEVFVTDVVMQFLGSVEARTAPAVTKADIEQAIRPKFEQWQSQLAAPVDRAIDAVWSLVSVADPVEELAGQIEAAARTAIRQVCDDLAAVAPSLDPLTVERAMEVTAASRKVAAHVLGQEASDE